MRPSCLSRRVITLQRYSIENYLFEKKPVEQICIQYCQKDNGESISCSLFDEVQNHIKKVFYNIVALDVAHTFMDTGNEVLPKK